MMPDHEDLNDDDERSSDETTTNADTDFAIRNDPSDWGDDQDDPE